MAVCGVSVSSDVCRQGVLPGMMARLLLHRPTLLPRLLLVVMRGASITDPFAVDHFTVIMSCVRVCFVLRAFDSARAMQIIPSRFGDGAAVRWSLAPCDAAAQQPPVPKEDNFVDRIAQEHVTQRGVCMNLRVQRQL